MAGLVSWAFDNRVGSSSTPLPMVGCTSMGGDWKFYIIYGIEESVSELAGVLSPISLLLWTLESMNN